MSQRTDEPGSPATQPTGNRDRWKLALAICAGALVLLFVGCLLVHHADARVNHTPMADARPVSVVKARASAFRDSRSYVGAVASWQEARIGPQYIAAYVTEVAVRPGAVVKRGDVLATLDCSHPTAASVAAEAAALAVGERARATADEVTWKNALLAGGFIAANDVELKTAQRNSEHAQLLQTRAQSRAASQDVNDCSLKAPFDGEIGSRSIDPGAFATPGTNIVSVVDRSVVRVVVDAPEQDFDVVAPGTVARVEMLATGAKLEATISRRAPKADPRTRTVHFEIDVPNPKREIPADTTAVIHIDTGAPVNATAIPLYSATEQEGKATLFIVENGIAHERRLAVLGETGGELYFDPKQLIENTEVVTEGRALLSDGDRVAAKPDGDGERGGGYGRPL